MECSHLKGLPAKFGSVLRRVRQLMVEDETFIHKEDDVTISYVRVTDGSNQTDMFDVPEQQIRRIYIEFRVDK
jgi:hypothetical protein